jgi:hypothetical protein
MDGNLDSGFDEVRSICPEARQELLRKLRSFSEVDQAFLMDVLKPDSSYRLDDEEDRKMIYILLKRLNVKS